MTADTTITAARKAIGDEAGRLEREAARLRKAAAALAGVGASQPRRGRQRAQSASTATRQAKRGRPKGSGKRAQQALDLVAGQPGITIPELAKAMKIQPNYLYRVLPGLAEEGRVKQGTRGDKGWYPA